ncbi:MAG: DNA translocase FtsK [Kiritimatiellales bacterium]
MAKKRSKEDDVPVRSPRREMIGVILLALCLMSFLSVFSFNPNDISLLCSPPASPPHNLIGPFGAWFAYFGLLLFGAGGWLVPFILLTGGLLMTFRSYERIWPVWTWLFISLTALAGFFEYQPALWSGLVARYNLGTPGGLIGNLLAVRTLGLLIGRTGAGVVFTAIIILALLQLTGMHPFTPFVFVWKQIRGVLRRNGRDNDEVLTTGKKPVKQRREKIKTIPAEELFIPAPEPEPVPAKPKKPLRDVLKPVAVPQEKSSDEAGGASVNIASGADQSGYQLPPVSLLDELLPLDQRTAQENTIEKAAILQRTLEQFSVEGAVTHVETGPTVTSYEITPAEGVRVEKISSLERNIALALKAQSIRIQAPIPGKGAVGIEVPNAKGSAVYLRELAESPAFHNPDITLPLALGKDVSGKMVVGDLASMPHMLIAGATGAGKTVCMNSLLTGLLLSCTPEQMRLILVDPKTFEFQAYENLKHLVVPIITDAKKVTLGLRWAIKEMEKRYALFKKLKVRDIKGFNNRAIEQQADLFGETALENRAPAEKENIPAKLPYIVIVIDELAELMGVAQQEIEPCIVRLAQLSRAAGIHMILATQRPSVNVITGTIKANIPGRIAFRVNQGNDSRTILDTVGAEKLLGKGDMLFLPPGKPKPVRLQGTWTSDAELHRVTDFIRQQGTPEFITEITQKMEDSKAELPAMDADDGMLEAAIEVLRQTKRATTSSLQRRLKIGYNRAANLMEVLEQKGIIGPPTETGPRDILVDLDGEIPDNEGAVPPVEGDAGGEPAEAAEVDPQEE